MSSAARPSRPCAKLMEFVLATIQRQRLLAPLPFGVAGVLGSVTETLNKLLLGLLPAEFVFTARSGRIAATRQSRVGKGQRRRAAPWPASASTPESIEEIVPTYLYRYPQDRPIRRPARGLRPFSL